MQDVLAFTRRDFLIWTSYRLQALRELGSLVIAVLVLIVLGKLLGESHAAFLDRYHTNYVGYFLTTVTFVEIWGVGFLLSKSLRDSQALGTLEAMMLSPMGLFRLLLYSTVFPTLVILVRLLLLTAVAVLLFGQWHQANVLSVLVLFAASILTMGCLGVLSSAFVLLLKQGDPIVPIYGLLNGLLSGAIFPPEALPTWLQPLSRILPLTYALDGMRQALAGASLLDIAPQVLALGGIFLVLLPVTLWTLSWATRRAKEEGSLVQY